ncbi:MAG: hypothetical protein GPJ54_00095 [Candidatus Heimdallarchaeota archaeon]|nr:hypothetical protein [Candidatus Heimdallarchaeota archaeon]
MNQIYLQIIHRTAFVIAIIPALVIPLLPQIFTEAKDKAFVEKAHRYMLITIRAVLLVSIVSGILRIPADINFAIAAKITLGGLVVASFYLIKDRTDDQYFQQITGLRVALMLITGLLGLLI